MTALVYYRLNGEHSQVKAVLVHETSRSLKVIVAGNQVRLLTLPKTEQRHMSPPILEHGHQVPLARVVKHFRRLGRERGISKAAKDLLREVSNVS